MRCRRHFAIPLCLAPILALLAPLPAPADVIDFETLPGGAPTVDQQTISDEYAPYGVTFTLLDKVTELPIGFPRIAKAGPPRTAFQGCTEDDSPLPGLDLGTSFLTDGVSLEVEGFVRIEYATPVAQASGVILDIDCRVNGGAPCEQWTITAYDSAGAELTSTVLDGLEGPENPECEYPDAGPGDSNAFGWVLDAGTPAIRSIIFRYTGSPTDVGLAFDHFSVASLPGPPVATATAEADTICFGEIVELGASVIGGLPPYSYRWEREISPDTWVDAGTGPTPSVQPLETTSYRVIATDTAANEGTSPPMTVTVATSDPLCDTSLLVCNYDNDTVIRYSFRSRLASLLVASGSGGLNGPSKMVVGDDDLLYVVSQGDNRVLRYDAATGNFIDTFVAAGSGGLNIPIGIDFGPDGNLYVASYATHEVLQYDGGDGSYLGEFVPNGSGLSGPSGLVFGPDDDLYVCSFNADKVLRFDGTTGTPLGDFVTSGSGGLDAPRGLIFGPLGDLYVSEQYNDSVRRYDGTSGAFLEVFVPTGSDGLNRANDVTFGPEGRLYVVSHDNNRVLRYDGSTGDPLGGLPDDLLVGPGWFALSGVPMATDVPVSAVRPLALSVEPNVPNPFGPRTTVGFTLPSPGPTRVAVHDVTGRRVVTLLDRALPAGRHSVRWNGSASGGRRVPSGVYFLRVESAGRSECVRMVLVR